VIQPNLLAIGCRHTISPHLGGRCGGRCTSCFGGPPCFLGLTDLNHIVKFCSWVSLRSSVSTRSLWLTLSAPSTWRPQRRPALHCRAAGIYSLIEFLGRRGSVPMVMHTPAPAAAARAFGRRRRWLPPPPLSTAAAAPGCRHRRPGLPLPPPRPPPPLLFAPAAPGRHCHRLLSPPPLPTQPPPAATAGPCRC